MRILFIADNFPPELNAAATRTYEHAVQWVRAGAQVTVLTCAPNFPQGRVYPGYRNALRQREIIDGIEVMRLWSYIAPNAGVLKRIIDQASFGASAAIAGLFHDADVIVASSPQFFTTWAGLFLGTVRRRPWIFELRDLWPASIVAVGAMKPGRMIRMLERIELYLYRRCAAVIANTPALRTNLVSRGIDPNKIHVIPNGVDLQAFRPRPKDPALLESLGLQGKFVVGYIGTHGMAHGLDFIVEAAAGLARERLHFLFVGDGAEKAKVRRRAAEVQLTNASFLDPVQKAQVADYIALMDVALVPLRRSETFKTVIPSKIFECAAMRKPILLGVEGQAQELVEHYAAGLCFRPEDADDFRAKLMRLMESADTYQTLQEGCARLAAAYERTRLADEMLSILKRVSSDRPRAAVPA
ncbi:MAG TPA: glycosyltransferase family 4 protein [Xanthobacteraceae bacterium]|nr:glycosyltransferase family 4 protein [Xanthobacteraceae bacterium]